MIKSLQDLRDRVNTIIKIIPNNSPQKTQAADVKQYLLDEIDSVENLVNQLGFSISNKLAEYTKTVDSFSGDYTKLSNKPTLFDGQWNSILGKPSFFDGSYNSLSAKPDLTKFRLNTDTISYNSLTDKPVIPAAFSKDYNDLLNKPTIPTYDLSIYQKNSDSIAFSRLTGVPNAFDGTWGSLTGKPTLFNGDYNSLVNKPTIPTYDLSLYRLKTDVVDYSSLANKPNMSKLLWNQTSMFTLTNTIAETNALVTGNGSLVIDANPTTNTSFRLTGRGLFNTQTLGPTPTLTIKLYLGNTIIATGSVASFLLGATNRPLSFYIDMNITSASTIYAQGSMSYFATIADSLSAAPILNGTGQNASVDLSISNQLKMTLTWSVANPSNTIQMKIINLEKLNN